jgi:cytochrome c biogenesis protein CcdA
MTSPDQNPFQSPSVEASIQPPPTGIGDPKLLKKFREQMVALGISRILLGLLGCGSLVYSFTRLAPHRARLERIVLSIIVIVCGLWVMLGVLRCMKSIWATQIALALTYILGLAQLSVFNLCGCVIAVLILQAHRVLGLVNFKTLASRFNVNRNSTAGVTW